MEQPIIFNIIIDPELLPTLNAVSAFSQKENTEFLQMQISSFFENLRNELNNILP